MITKMNKNQEVLIESSNKKPKEIAKDYKSGAKLIYAHMLKWRYWINVREENAGEWTKTIFREIYNFKVDDDVNANVIKIINDSLYEEYRNGWKEADKEIKRDSYGIRIPDNDDLYYEFDSCEKLFDFDNIRNWLDDGTLGRKAEASLEKAYNDKTEALSDKNRSSKSNKQSTRLENNTKGRRKTKDTRRKFHYEYIDAEEDQ